MELLEILQVVGICAGVIALLFAGFAHLENKMSKLEQKLSDTNAKLAGVEKQSEIALSLIGRSELTTKNIEKECEECQK